MPYTVSDYVASLTPDDRSNYLTLLFDKNTNTISWLLGSPQTATIVLNLHIMLANLLVHEPARADYWLVPYHVTAAAEIWSRFGDPKTPLAAMFSPGVLEGICRDGVRLCTSACNQSRASWRTCSTDCAALATRAASAVCL